MIEVHDLHSILKSIGDHVPNPLGAIAEEDGGAGGCIAGLDGFGIEHGA